MFRRTALVGVAVVAAVALLSLPARAQTPALTPATKETLVKQVAKGTFIEAHAGARDLRSGGRRPRAR